MKRSTLVSSTVVGLLILSLIGTVFFLMARHQISFVTLVNKVANVITLVERDELLISSAPKHTQTSLNGIKQQRYPRILMHQLGGWNGRQVPRVFSHRVNIINQQHLGFRIDCKRQRIGYRLNCFVSDPKPEHFNALINALLTYRFIKPTVGNNTSNSLDFALAVDVIKASPRLSLTQSQQLDHHLIEQLKRLLVLLDDDGASLWHSRATLSAETFLLASVLDLSSEAHQLLYRRALGHFEYTVQAMRATPTWPGGYNYWINNRALMAVLALSTYANAQQSAALRDSVIALIKQIGLAHIYLTRPDFKIQGWADEGPRIDLKDETARVIDVISQVTGEQALFRFSNSIRDKFGNESYYRGYRWMLPWLYAPEQYIGLDVKAKRKRNKSNRLAAVSDLPLSMLFGREMTNHLVIRQGWGDNDTFMTYRAGHIFSHHQHYDAGHFTLFKGAPLLVDASQYNGSVMSSRRINIDIRTLAKNSLLIQQPDEQVKPNYKFTENVAAGGQRVVIPTGSVVTDFKHWQSQLDSGAHFAGARLIRFAQSPMQYTSISSDLTSAYNSTRYTTPGNQAKVKQVIRHLAYLHQYDVALTYDKILTTDRTYKTKWLGHTINKPQAHSLKTLRGTPQDGILSTINNQLTIKNGVSKLTVSILEPSLSSTLIVGGDQYQHYVESDGDDSQLNGQFYSQGFSVKRWHDPALWRFEVSPLNQTQLTRYMMVMQPTLGNESALIKRRLQHSNGGAAQLGELLILWPHQTPNWQLQTEAQAKQLIIMLDKAQLLWLTVDGVNYAKVIDGKIGFNLIEHSFGANAIITLTPQ